MNRSGLKFLSFAAGLLLVGMGTFDLYLGLIQAGGIEALNLELSRGFMLLFPGYAFLAYSLHASIALTSHGLVRGQAELETEAEPEFLHDDLPENVVVFPGQPFERGPGRSGFRRYR